MTGPPIPEPWNSFLRELDDLVTAETRLDCMGGFVMTQLYGFSRATSDLDVVEIAPREQNRLLEPARPGKAGNCIVSTRSILTMWQWRKFQKTTNIG